MNRIILLLSSLILCCIYSNSTYSQVKVSRINLGLNLVPLYDGTPELQGEYVVNRYLSGVVAGGYSYHPVRGFAKIWDGIELNAAKGTYMKIGVKGSIMHPKKRMPALWVQLLYIRAAYDEHATSENDDNTFVQMHISGNVQGFAAGIGGDFFVGNRIVFHVGGQFGHCSDRQHLSNEFMTYQPGFGTIEDGLTIIGNIGCSYRFGKALRQQKVEAKKQ